MENGKTIIFKMDFFTMNINMCSYLFFRETYFINQIIDTSSISKDKIKLGGSSTQIHGSDSGARDFGLIFGN
jgi:hypothetical protein